MRGSGGTRTASGWWAAQNGWVPGTQHLHYRDRCHEPLAERQPRISTTAAGTTRQPEERARQREEHDLCLDGQQLRRDGASTNLARISRPTRCRCRNLSANPIYATHHLRLTGSSNPLHGLSQVFKVPAATEATRTTGIAIVSSPAIGDSSRLGETAEVEVTYSEAVTVRGTPLVGLSVGSATGDSDNVYNAAYTISAGRVRRTWSSSGAGA